MKSLGLHERKSIIGPTLAHTTFASDIDPEDAVLIYCRRTNNNAVVKVVKKQARNAKVTTPVRMILATGNSFPDHEEAEDEENEETLGTLPMGDSPGSLLGMFVNPMDGALWGATSTGELYCCPKSNGSVEGSLGDIIGCIPSGILAWCPRPDGEMLALVTGEGQLVLLETSSWSVLWERSLEEILSTAVKAEGAGASVGWGRKETQFHGKAGKAAALARETIREALLATDDRLPRLGWRPDGELLACSFVHRQQRQQTEEDATETEASACRELLIISPNDTTDSLAAATMGEPIEGMGMAMAWRGDGSLIAVHQQRANHEHWIVFYERNGLRHGEFRLNNLPPTDSTVIKALTWNCDGSILAVHHYQQQQTAERGRDSSMVDLWTTSNYHWYLKYRLLQEPIEEVSWSVNNPYVLVTREAASGDEGGHLKEYTFFETIHRSSCTGRNDPLSLVAVTDGSRLLLTALALANIPPPFSQTVIELEDYWIPSWVSIVVGGGDGVATTNDGCLLLAASCQGHLVAYRIEGESKEIGTATGTTSSLSRPPSLKATLLWSLSLGLSVKQVVATREARIIYGLTMGGRLFCLDGTSKRVIHLAMTASPLTLFASGPSWAVGTREEGYKPYVQTRDGDIMPLPEIGSREIMMVFDDDTEDNDKPPTSFLLEPIEYRDDQNVSLPSPLIATKDGQTFFRLGSEQKGVFSYFTLSGTSGILATDCTSFMLLDDFVCWTNPAGLLRFRPLSLLFLAQQRGSGHQQPLQQPYSLGRTEEAERLTEGGARLIAAIPRAASLVLQMPRGNLETIYPRALLLSLVKRLLDGLYYREAFLTCRRHHLDMNLLHDHNAPLFRSTLGKFLEALPEAEHLNYFLTSLRNINVMHTRYAPLEGGQERRMIAREGVPIVKTGTDDPFSNKVNELCEAFRDEFLRSKVSRHQFAEPLMTTFVVQQPPDHEAALNIIIDLQKEPAVMERALKYLLFLVPAERLYRTALGLYNLPMALSVARRSTLDPTEYTTFLSDLHRCQPLARQKHRIDDYLQRHERALQHLLRCEDASWGEEILPYIQRHTLYRAAFGMLPDMDATHYWPSLCVAYGEYEEGRGNLRIAVDLFAHAGDRAHALGLAITAGYWQKALALNAEEQQLVRLVEVLRQGRRYEEAFTLVARYLENPALLTEIAIEGRLWTAGGVSIVAGDDVNLRQSLVRGALQCREQVLVEVKQLVADLTEKFERLEKVQTQLVSELDPSYIRAALEGGDGTLSSSSPFSEAGDDSLSDRLSTLSMRTGTSILSTLSGTSTLASISRASTSKNKRKADKQRMRGKPGSPFEREYLRDTLRELITRVGTLGGGEGMRDLLQFLADERQFVAARSLQEALLDLCALLEDYCVRLQRLVQAQEERMTPELLSLLGLTPWSIPSTLQVDHVWKTAFDIPPRLRSFLIAYL